MLFLYVCQIFLFFQFQFFSITDWLLLRAMLRGDNSGRKSGADRGKKRPSAAAAPLQTPGSPLLGAPKRVKKRVISAHAGGLFLGAQAPLRGRSSGAASGAEPPGGSDAALPRHPQCHP